MARVWPKPTTHAGPIYLRGTMSRMEKTENFNGNVNHVFYLLLARSLSQTKETSRHPPPKPTQLPKPEFVIHPLWKLTQFFEILSTPMTYVHYKEKSQRTKIQNPPVGVGR